MGGPQYAPFANSTYHRGPMHNPFHPPRLESPEVVADFFPDVVQGILPLGSLCILAGEPKSGKTDFATALSFAIASGQPFAGHKTQGGPVLWCAYEETVLERYAMHQFCPRQADGEFVPFQISYNLPPIDSEYGCDLIEFALAETRPRMLVIDSLSSAVSQTGVGGAQGMRSLLSRYREMAYRQNVVVLILHHVTKATSGSVVSRLAHSHAIAAASCGHFLLESEPVVDADQNEGRFVTLKMSGRLVGQKNLEFWSPGIINYQPTRNFSALTVTAGRVLKAIRDGHDTYEKLQKETGYMYQTLRCAMVELTRRGLVYKENLAEKRSLKFAVPSKTTVLSSAPKEINNTEILSEPLPVSLEMGRGRGGANPAETSDYAAFASGASKPGTTESAGR